MRWAAARRAVALGLAAISATAAAGQRPTTMETCKVCHAPAADVVRGKLVSIAPELGTLSVTVGPLVWIVKYGEGVKVKEGDRIVGPAALKAIPRDRELAVTFTGPETRPLAVEISVKQPYKVPAAKLVTVERMQELVAHGAGQGKLTLVDSRPAAMFAEGHLPGAVSLPYTVLKERGAAALPADRSAPIVFYCAGET